MSVVSIVELIEQSRNILGDSDEHITFLENLTDTLNSYEDAEDWRSRYVENDAVWRKRYRDRFYNNEVENEEVVFEANEDETTVEELKIDDLFEEK